MSPSGMKTPQAPIGANPRRSRSGDAGPCHVRIRQVKVLQNQRIA
jgi:hypothetical protein